MKNEEYYYWPADLLVHHIVQMHHVHIHQLIPEIKASFNRLITSHGRAYPALYEAQILFLQYALELQVHLAKEAIAVLPFAKRYAKELHKHREVRKPGLFSVCTSIDKMYHEHKTGEIHFGELMDIMEQLQMLKQDHILFQYTCTKLEELRQHLQELVHLENDILFPKLIEMEATLYPI